MSPTDRLLMIALPVGVLALVFGLLWLLTIAPGGVRIGRLAILHVLALIDERGYRGGFQTLDGLELAMVVFCAGMSVRPPSRLAFVVAAASLRLQGLIWRVGDRYAIAERGREWLGTRAA